LAFTKIAPHNRAGAGQPESIQLRTLEDLPGPLDGRLAFHSILLDSVNVSWSAPRQPNGHIRCYLVRYRTASHRQQQELRKDIQVSCIFR
jgi:hypothetical protein